MRTLQFDVKGDNNLAAINVILSDQEKKFCEFMDSKIVYEEGAAVNLVTFKAYDVPNETPPKLNDLILQEKKSETPPPNKFWEGVMVAGGNLTVVVASRAN